MKTISINGTDRDDFIFVFDQFGQVTARKGDDRIQFASADDVRVDGGFGHDEFDFYYLSNQRMTLNEINDDKTVIKIRDLDGDVQKIVLIDVEEITWSIEKGLDL